MEIIYNLPADLHSKLFFILIFLLCFVTSFIYSFHNIDNRVKSRQNQAIQYTAISLLTIFLACFIGFRGLHGFHDTTMYAHVYENLSESYSQIDFNEEWLWDNITFFCKSLGLSVSGYFVTIAALYLIGMFACCSMLTRDNIWVAMLLFLSSFSFYGYATNGLTNGVAASFGLVGIAFLASRKTYTNVAIAIIILFLALSIHRSLILPGTCALIAAFFLKKPQYAITFWIVSIPISLLAGDIITDFFVNLGFDERMEQYANLPSENLERFDTESLGGGREFRWDFLVYSTIPILLVWYLTVKRNFQDYTYNVISITYILANSFWIMVIRSEQSNRFAYLSWFLYPLVIAYPLLRMKIWEEQDRKFALILLAYAGFTVFMQFV